MTHLDINTPKGQVTLTDEQLAIDLFEAWFTESTYIKTPKAGTSIIDGVIERAGVVVGIAETNAGTT
jgi:hypothetical protein